MQESTFHWNARACALLWKRQDHSGGKGWERAGGADRLIQCTVLAPGADRDQGWTTIAMALCLLASGRSCCRTPGDAAREVKAALLAMPVKTDRNDARGISQLMPPRSLQ